MNVYADHAATTKISPAALAAMLPCFTEVYGNPSSPHAVGQAASRLLVHARSMIARCLNCRPEELTFTSCGSESDTQALLSAARNGAKQGKRHIVSTAFEHHAVLRTLERLSREGFTIELLPVGPTGTVTAAQVAAALCPGTCLVSVMYANNEIGSVLPVGEFGALCRERGVAFHTDAVQAAGHLPIDVRAQSIDLLSLSAHKFNGPKGAGVLYARRGTPLVSLIEGGAQERGKRAGTENMPAIVGMAAALEESCNHMAENAARVSALRDRLAAGLSAIPHSRLNGDTSHRLPGTVSLCFEGIEGEALLLLLDAAGICASSGSACASGSLEPSHVLLALGLPPELANGALRLSLGAENTDDEIDYLLAEIPKAVAALRERSPVWREKTRGLRPFLL